QEPFDPARFVGNASTGATGIALAREAVARGADVTLILGPSALEPPAGARVVRVRTAREMHDAAMRDAVGADIVIAAAAVADWRPAEYSAEKIKKTDEDLVVRMTRNPDVLARIGDRKGSTFLVGFAAETADHEVSARGKMARKHLDAIAVNDVRDGRGFGTGTNALSLLYGADGRIDLGEADKATLAARLLDAIERLMEEA
ncbi:MAG: bifunctional 4'-phosphopantothenoylcysteine decarboxylase/phosphopantothenoylcysteine synthetase, partial [Candidatus Eremiobacteraeota bacterium]|nr:bifunctional 4'-phosphopantothenoylcysteine decarboxylase/phosphopantothenoylcysteine synthetase [Candidatus Eremiobacteraeota bacterium]